MSWSRREFLAAGVAATAAARWSAAKAADRADTDADVLVIGAGLSGLAAAMALQDAELRVGVLEARTRVGGKVLTFKDVPGQPEAGGQSMGAGYGRVLNAARRFGIGLVDVLPQQIRHGVVECVLDGRVVSRQEWPSSPRNPFPAAQKALMPWEYVPALAERANPLRSVEGWYGPGNAVHDVSMHEFLKGQGASDAMIELAYDTNANYGTSAHDVSALQLLFASAWARVQREIKPSAMYVASGGNQRIPEAMAAALKRPVRLGSVVTGVATGERGVTVHCADGSVHRARAVICALPFSVARQIRFDPVLGGVQAEAIKTLPHQDIVQFALLSRRPFWKDDGLSPMMWCEGLLSRTFAVRDAAGEVLSLQVTAYGDKARQLDRLGREEACRRIVAEFEAARPAARGQLQVAGYHSWGLDAFAGGDWAVFRPGTVTRYLPAMSQPHGRIHFCGEQTALANRGMEGAMESGERAALEALEYF